MNRVSNLGIRWWQWTTGLHVLFLLVIYHIIENIGFNQNHVLQHLSLVRENNLAVWWSGFCLMCAGLLFYRLASSQSAAPLDRVMWMVLALVILGLSIDETGSLHERVSMLGGWWALLPFAILGGGGFAFAIARCFMTPGFRVSGVLILISLGLFAGVAGMEEFGNVYSDTTTIIFAFRHVIEEGMELFSESLLLLSGVLALRTSLGQNFGEISIIVQPSQLMALHQFLYLGLALHLCVTVIWMPYLWDLERGNPAYWFPMLTFNLSAFICIYRFRQTSEKIWLYTLVVLLLLSIGQMQNFAILLSQLSGSASMPIYQDFYFRMLFTLVPLLPVLITRVPWKTLLLHLFLLGGVVAMLRNGAELFESYYIFSGLFAMMVFNLLTVHRNADEIHPN
ncbi:MAG: hypothetical protein ACI8P9_001289 [Parasphingorhabdus sp.]|jgi:hypothetical protein